METDDAVDDSMTAHGRCSAYLEPLPGSYGHRTAEEKPIYEGSQPSKSAEPAKYADDGRAADAAEPGPLEAYVPPSLDAVYQHAVGMFAGGTDTSVAWTVTCFADTCASVTSSRPLLCPRVGGFP